MKNLFVALVFLSSSMSLFGQSFKTGQAPYTSKDNLIRQLDIESQFCMRCHNEQHSLKIEVRSSETLIPYDQSMRTTNHSMGMVYQTAYQRSPQEYIAPSSLNPNIKLIGGKVGCLSCHVAKNRAFASISLVVDVESNECTVDKQATEKAFAGSLCTQCHNK